MEKIIKNKLLFQSIAMFLGWLLIFYTCLFFIPSLFIVFMSSHVIGVSLLLTLIGLFILALVTIRGKQWSYIGWSSLTIAVIVFIFTIPNGEGLTYLAVITGLIAFSSYIGFGYKIRTSPIGYFTGVTMLIIFVSHSIIISSPQKFNLDVKGDELSSFFARSVSEATDITPLEFVKTETGRKEAIKVYNVSFFISQDELNKVVETNPQPLANVQKSLVSTVETVKTSPYGYILNMYLYSIIKSFNK